ncbi:hypothetical protein LY76DRAFT_599688 [Colletotrichum caudatum]|nr:hypothetical protein LY76DRAFT_599688 [Colletotrichum caudatum]
MASLASNLAGSIIYTYITPDFAVINREFNFLSFTKRKAVGIFSLKLLAKDQPNYKAKQSPRLEDLPYYADVIKAAAKAIKATDKYNRIAANRL